MLIILNLIINQNYYIKLTIFIRFLIYFIIKYNDIYNKFIYSVNLSTHQVCKLANIIYIINSISYTIKHVYYIIYLGIIINNCHIIIYTRCTTLYDSHIHPYYNLLNKIYT